MTYIDFAKGSKQENVDLSKNPEKAAVNVSHLRKVFHGHIALDNVSLQVGFGEVAAIVGPSGSGKTTLVRCTSLLSIPDDGVIELFGETVYDSANGSNKLNQTEARRCYSKQLARVGVVFQSLNLWPHRTVLQNVADPLVRVRGFTRADAEAKAANQLELLGLLGKLSRWPDTLSGGERQRVALARALVSDPDILFLDEITSSLDLERVIELLTLLRELARSKITLIIVTHLLALAAEVSDQLFFMDQGRIIESGPPQEVLNSPKNERVKEFVARVNRGFRFTLAGC